MICDSPFYVLPKAALEKVPVPCGRCPSCKLRRVNSWVFRLLQQEKVSDTALFVTLTYDTRFVPITSNGFMTLKKKDYQDFMKRLRKLTSATLKYYAVGEYGTNNNRPHYHAILFNCPDPELINQAWGLGSVHCGKVTSDSIAYTMKYIDKQKGKRLHARDDREPEFPLMSKGLGKNYLSDDVVGYHRADLTRLYVTKEGGHRIALPRYYREKIYSDDDKRKQTRIIQDRVEIEEQNSIREFEQLYPAGSGYTYEQYKSSARYGRYRRFYSNQKNRDI